MLMNILPMKIINTEYFTFLEISGIGKRCTEIQSATFKVLLRTR
jgi:hypothetical protein